MNRLIAALAALLLAPTAIAQDATQPAEQPAGPDLATLEGKVTSLEEQYLETKSTVTGLAKLRISGYIQARYAWKQSGLAYERITGEAAPSPAVAPNEYNTTPLEPISQNGFFIRRGRFKAVYTGDMTDYVLQIDVVPSGVSIKEGYATLKLPKGWAIDAGLQLFPFGYEVFSRSSSDLDTLERSAVTRAFLAGEYDLGVALRGRLFDLVNLKVGVFNGNGIDAIEGTGKGLDNDQLKDVIGRATVDFGMITAGVSGWYGKTINYARDDDKSYPRVRAAADLQLYLDLLPFGGTALKGEYIWGKTTIGNPSTSNGGAGRNLPGLTSGAPVPTGSGWYVILTQNVLSSWQLAARFEQYTPDHTYDLTAASSACPGPAADPRQCTVAQQREVQVALHTFVGENGKVTLAWFHPMNGAAGDDAKEPNADQYIVQVQAKF